MSNDVDALRKLLSLMQDAHARPSPDTTLVSDAEYRLVCGFSSALPALSRLLDGTEVRHTRNFDELRKAMSPEAQARATARTSEMLKELVQPNSTPEVLPWMSRAADAIADIYLPNCPVAHRLSIEYQIARFAPCEVKK